MEPNVIKPFKEGFTIYSKSKCKYCDLSKELLKQEDKSYKVIDCESYLEDDDVLETFLDMIEELAGKPISKFPMIFNNGIFVGGYKELKENLEKSNLLSCDCDDF